MNKSKIDKKAVIEWLENDGRYFTQDETACMFGVTGERVRQIVAQFQIARPVRNYSEAMAEIRRLKNINHKEATK